MSLIALEEHYAWDPASVGADRVMFSVDYPMDDNQAGAAFTAAFPMDDATRRKISSENAIRLFGSRIPNAIGA